MTSSIYGFQSHLTAAFPSQILMDITEVCNLACVHCAHPTFSKSIHYAKRYIDPALNSKMVTEVKEFGAGCTQYIRYASNGEPLMHPDAYDMIEDAVRTSGVYVTLTTNGTILNDRAVNRLLAAGLHLIDISIDAHTPESYETIRVNGNLSVTKRNILRLLEINKSNGSPTKIVVSFVEQPMNLHEVASFEDFWNDAGVDQVVIRRLHSTSGSNEALANHLRAAQATRVRKPCLYPWERVVINAKGEIAFCPSDWVHGSTVADYSTTTIRDIWSGPFYQSLREAHLANLFSSHAFCGQCPDWESTRWPSEGRSYASMVMDFSGQSADGPINEPLSD